MSNSQHQQRAPGMPCPQCGCFLEMRIQDLLFNTQFKCVYCGLEMHMDRDESRVSLNALQQLHVAMDNVEAAKRGLGGGT
ncbi:MAG TPA: hypothetical protein PK156_05835, partial [Polyangium sp.]|nr:hypothetical protein [Polyangium sp.]